MRWGHGVGLLAAAMLAALALPGAALAFGPLASFGEFGSGPGQLSSPGQATVDAAGDVYVADSGNDRISVFAGDGTFLRTFGDGLQEPADVALDGDGRAFVADSGNGRIVVFSATGTPLPFGEGTLSEPSGVAVDGSTVYVADSGNERIAVFTAAGDPDGEIPLASPPRDVIAGPDGYLYVADYGNREVDVYAKDGELRDSFADPGDLLGPVSLASDGADEIYVADQLAQRIERFSLGGTHRGGFDAEPEVAGVALACQGNVFAVSAQLARITRFGEPGTPPPPCAAAPQAPPPANPFAKPPSNRLRFAGLRRNRRNGSAVLFVRVGGPGKVFLWGRGVRRVRRGTQRAKRVRLPVRPKIPLKRFLKRRGKAAIRVNVGFQPVGGTPRTFEKRIVLKRKRARRYRRGT